MNKYTCHLLVNNNKLKKELVAKKQNKFLGHNFNNLPLALILNIYGCQFAHLHIQVSVKLLLGHY